jgi:hypothetical protein
VKGSRALRLDNIVTNGMTVRVAALLAPLSVVALSLASGPEDASARSSQSFTVINRTMVCATAFEGGAPDRIRSLSVSTGRELGEGRGQFAASISLGTGRGASASLVSIQADSASTSRPWVLVNRRRCKTIKASVPPAREERTAAAVEFSAGCKLLDAPPRVLVRLRASMQSPTRWSLYREQYLWARGTPLDASVIVRTYPARKPIAFASFDRSGAARFFAVPSCRE